MTIYIKFPNDLLRDAFYEASRNACSDNGEHMLNWTFLYHGSNSTVYIDRDNINDFALLGDFMQMYKGTLE